MTFTKKNSLVFFFSTLIFLLPVFSLAQERWTGTDGISARFNKYCESKLFDELFIHSDRDAYAAGETILVKAYLFDRGSLLLTGRSSYAYAELVNQLNKPVARIKILLENGTGSSVIEIPDTVYNGLYTLRAYTNLGKNYMPYGCFRKSILIVNPFNNKFVNFNTVPGTDNERPFKVNFYPEGGKIVSGLPARVGVHVFDRFGNPGSFNGTLTDETGNTITQITIDSTGLGIVEFTPEEGKSYVAECRESKVHFPLPQADESGQTLTVEGLTSDLLTLLVRRTDNSSAELKSRIFVIIRSQGKLPYARAEILEESETLFKIPATALATGINDIVIFNPAGNVINERFIYVAGTTSENETKYVNEELTTRQKAEIEPGPLSELKQSQSSISVSINITGLNNSCLNDYLVFGSEYRIENQIRDIAGLFSISDQVKRDILLLGLVDNWIDWSDVMFHPDKKLQHSQESIGQYITFMSTSKISREENWYKPAIMTIPGNAAQFQYSLPDSNMTYTFIGEKGFIEKDMVIQMPDTGINNTFSIMEPFSEEYIIQPFIADTVRPSFIPTDVEMISRNYQVMKMYDRSDIVLRDADADSIPRVVRFYGKPDQELIMNNYIKLPEMKEVFRELIPGITMRTLNGVISFHVIDLTSNSILDGVPSMFLDGVLIHDPKVILNLNPELVEKIDIITTTYYVGDFTFRGIINVITKTGDFSSADLPGNAVRVRYRFYNPPVEFKTIDYSDPDERKSRIPDFRNTLFWDDGMKRDGEDHNSLSFWTSDYTSEYRVIIQGIDSSGRPVSKKRVIEVK